MPGYNEPLENASPNELTKFVKVFEGVLTEDQCNFAVNYFDDNEKEKAAMITAWSQEKQEYVVEESRKILEIKLELQTEVDNMFQASCGDVLNRYVGSVDLYPLTASYDDGYSIYKYSPKEHYYDWHVDTMPNSPRVATMIWYLNDVEEGGETEFSFGMKVKPKKGNVLIFPSNFCFPHRACVPVSGPKYVGLTFIVNTPPI